MFEHFHRAGASGQQDGSSKAHVLLIPGTAAERSGHCAMCIGTMVQEEPYDAGLLLAK